VTTTEDLDEAVKSLRALILAGESYRQAVALITGLGVTEAQAVSYLAVHGERGQNELGADLGITSSASTALVDRLERQGIADRHAHPRDRRRVVVGLSDKGHAVVELSHDWLAASLRSIPPSDLAEVADTLQQIARDLRGQSEHMLATRD
jgi:DNA-binding MarR family transcriptional regulator